MHSEKFSVQRNHGLGLVYRCLRLAYRCLCLSGLALAAIPAVAAEPQPAAARLPQVEVIGTTPLPGIGLARDQIPSPVQSATEADLRRGNSLDLADFLNRNLGGVHINDMQGNPFQPDVNYRGFTASPLLGTPQGLSVYLDGVRLNQPFGDVVSWDLIPKSAIASINLMPGSNPLFGLNTLGGALSIQTKDGRSHPGSALQATVGMHCASVLDHREARLCHVVYLETRTGMGGVRPSGGSGLHPRRMSNVVVCRFYALRGMSRTRSPYRLVVLTVVLGAPGPAYELEA